MGFKGVKIIWACFLWWCENVSSGICQQQRPRPAALWSGPSLSTNRIRYYRMYEWGAKALMILWTYQDGLNLNFWPMMEGAFPHDLAQIRRAYIFIIFILFPRFFTKAWLEFHHADWQTKMQNVKLCFSGITSKINLPSLGTHKINSGK